LATNSGNWRVGAAARPDSRRLAPGERRLAASVFGDTVALDAVTIRCAKFWALHPWWVTMAPDGHIWLHPNGDTWCTDFAGQSVAMQAHFVHEMVHVWQAQHGGNLVWRRWPFARYGYDIVPGKPFARYGLEQQACIVADAWLLREGRQVPGKPGLADYADIIPFGRWVQNCL
jgi:hypothetical protein